MALSTASFEYVRTILRQRSAHYLEEDKGYLVETRLLPVARRPGFASVEELLLRLRARSNEALLAEPVIARDFKEFLRICGMTHARRRITRRATARSNARIACSSLSSRRQSSCSR